MLQKYSEVLNLPVICASNGKQAGIVKDILFNMETREVRAFLLEHRGVEVARRLVPLKDVLGFGAGAMVIDSIAGIAKMGRDEYYRTFGRNKSVLGLRIFTKDGEDLGFVKDVVFDPATGRVEGVEVSEGFFQDMVKGRSILPLFGKVEFGEENVLVGREAVEEMANTGGGIKNRLGRE